MPTLKNAWLHVLTLAALAMLVATLLLNGARQGTFSASSSSASTATPRRSLPSEVFPGVSLREITRIEIEAVTVNERIILVKAPGDWKVTNPQGTPVAHNIVQVTRMLEVLVALPIQESYITENFGEYGLGGSGYFLVQFEASGRTYTMHVGEINSSQTGVFIRRGIATTMDPLVYLVPREPIITLLVLLAERVDTPN